MLQRKRSVKAIDIIRDLRSGMTFPQLIHKYKISLKALRFVFRKLLDVGAIKKDELAAQAALYRDTGNLKGVRKCLRTTTTFPVRIYDSGNPFTTGYVLDISTKGVCVKGIEAVVGEIMNFIVRSGAFGQAQTFVFEGKCRWVRKEQLSVKEWVAGFEITNISSLDSSELQKLIRSVDDQHLERRISESIQATFGGIH
jgi:PilZ domain